MQTRPRRGPLRSLGLDWEFGVALMAYGAASLADYLLTLTGLLDREIRELNPLLNLYIEHFGAQHGLIIPKLLLGFTAVTASSLYIQAMHRKGKTRLRAQHLLYPGALFTALAPLHWVVQKYWHGPWG
jgi:hypothetical protein